MLIKCPECGKDVSDKAPTCPHCGVPIAGHIKEQSALADNPHCAQTSPQPQQQQSHRNTGIYLFSFILAVAICGVAFYFYNNAKSTDEQAQYELAIRSNDPEILRAFLTNYPDAPREHRDSVQFHLTTMNQIEREWNDVIISNSRSAFQRYIEGHPGSAYEKVAIHKIDSIDWASAEGANTPGALKSYIEGHPNGEHIDEANEIIRNLNATTVMPEEKQMISSIFRTFFQSVNSKDEDRLTSTVNSLLTTFLGKSDATKSDVIYFMNKLWKEDVKNLNWRIIDDYKIEKKEVGDGEYEYSVTFSATETVNKVSDTKEPEPIHYRIKAKVNPDGKISDFTMSKVIQ